MRGGTLTRLRLGFLLLGAALLGPLFALSRSVEARLEAQRKLRHQIVAERIFDEMERELTALLAREGERPSWAYDSTQTRVESWAPFVVGYFTQDAEGVRVIAREQLANERAAQVERAVTKGAPATREPRPERDAATPGALQPKLSRDKLDSVKGAAPRAKSDAVLEKKALPAKQQPDEVLRQLNRAAEQRQEPKRKTRSAPEPRSSRLDEATDPLNGL